MFQNIGEKTQLWQVLTRVEKNPFFFKNPTHPLFGLKKTFFWVLKQKQVFVLFLIKTEKPIMNLLLLRHAISPFSELRLNNLLYLLLHSKLRVKKCTPSCFRSVVGQFAANGKTT